MSYLFIGSTGDRAGQSLMAWAIGRRLLKNGLSVGFMKPFGTHSVRKDGHLTDMDGLLFKEVLGLTESLDSICPFPASAEEWRQNTPDELMNKIRSLAHNLSTDKDVLIIMGSKHIFFDSPSSPIPDTALISALEADCIIVNRFRKTSTSIYSILSVSSLLGEKIRGVIINRVPTEKMEGVRGQMIPSLVQKGIPVSSALPEAPLLSFLSLREIRDIIDGKLLCGDDRLGQPVGNMTVGSTDLKGELIIFKKVYNKIILLEPSSPVVGADKLPSQRSVAGILLTGGRGPVPQLLQIAKKNNIPLMLVKQDCFAALERMEQVTPALTSEDEFKVSHFSELMDYDGALDRLLKSLGLIP